jgi:hypothetical protein
MTSATPALALTPTRADQPPAALLELAAETGASLAYTAAAGWHLLPDPELVRQVQALDRREARRKTPPPASSVVAEVVTAQPAAPDVPSLASLDEWLDTVNTALLAEQGYSNAGRGA